jgi:hypothetical protein
MVRGYLHCIVVLPGGGGPQVAKLRVIAMSAFTSNMRTNGFTKINIKQFNG